MSDENNGRLLWFLAGAAIGATIALLYAPYSGVETRSRLSKKVQEGRDALAEGGQELYERGKQLYEKGKAVAEEAAELFDRGKDLAQG